MINNGSYHKLPTNVSLAHFRRYIEPYLSKGKRGPKPKISLARIFNYILYVLHTGIQWQEIKTRNNEVYWTTVYKRHHRWCHDGSYDRLFKHSVHLLNVFGKLDLSVLHGDGSNAIAKKGAKTLGTLATNTRKESRR